MYKNNKGTGNINLECTVIQGGFSAPDYRLFEKYPKLKEKLTNKYLSHVNQNHNSDLLIIPESAFPFTYNMESPLIKQLGEIAVKNNSNIYASFIYREEENEFSSVALINKKGVITGKYNKSNPVYFFESELIKRGNDNTLFTVEGTTVAPLICFDVVFLNNFFNRSDDVDLYIVTSNDVFAENTVLAKLHKAYAVINARTAGKPLLQVVQNGPSFFVNSKGTLFNITEKYEEVIGRKVIIN